MRRSRHGGPVADDPHGVQELHPVEVNVGLGRGPADQHADLGESASSRRSPGELCPGSLTAAHGQGRAGGSLDLVVAGHVLPPSVIGLRHPGAAHARHAYAASAAGNSSRSAPLASQRRPVQQPRGRHPPRKCPLKRTLIGITGRWLVALDGRIKPERADDQREYPRGRLLTLPGTPRRHPHDCLWSRR